MPVLSLDLPVQRLAEVTDGNHPRQFAAIDHGQLAESVQRIEARAHSALSAASSDDFSGLWGRRRPELS